LNDAWQVNTPRKNLQTLGVAALYVSAKFEERFPPPLRDLEYITGYRCDTKLRFVLNQRGQVMLGCSSNTAAILEMEAAILVAVRALAPQLSPMFQDDASAINSLKTVSQVDYCLVRPSPFTFMARFSKVRARSSRSARYTPNQPTFRLTPDVDRQSG
jgi:hypothetical protein